MRKVGDKARVKSYKELEKLYPNANICLIDPLCGKEVTITEIWLTTETTKYCIKESKLIVF